MAMRPHYAGWPSQQPAPPSSYEQNAAGERRPEMPRPLYSPRPSPAGFHHFPSRGSGAPPGPPGYGAYRNLYSPSGRSPGFNNNCPGWSPHPRGYPATLPSPRMLSPNTTHSESQAFIHGVGYGAHGNFVSVGPPNQSQGQSQVMQGHERLLLRTYISRGATVESHGASAVVPWSNDVRPNLSSKTLFLNWIDESVEDSSSSQLQEDSGGRGLGLRTSSDTSAVPRSSDLYGLVEQVEDTISKILALTDLRTSGSDWGTCPFNPHHVVPSETLLRHTLRCPSSLAGSVEASCFLHRLQYPHTVDVAPTQPSAQDERVNDQSPGVESSSNNAVLSFEDTALLNVNHTPTKRLDLEIIMRESGYVDSENSSESSRDKAKVGATNRSEESECRSLTLSTSRQQFDPRGSFFFYGEAPGVVLTSLAYYSSKDVGDAMSSMPHSLRVELEKCPYKSVRNEETSNRSIVSSTGTTGTTGISGVKNRLIEAEEEESHGKREDGACENYVSCVKFLPSMLWNLGKELETWKDMTSQTSRTVIEAGTGLGRVRKASIVEWLLVHSPAYGVVLDLAMAAHISCLVQLYLKALRTQSLLLFDQNFAKGLNKRDASISSDTMVVECPMYAEASTWLASCLSHLYGPVNSKAVVLGISKHCLSSCGRFLSVVPLDLRSRPVGYKTREKSEVVKGVVDIDFEVYMEHSKMLSKVTDNASFNASNLLAVEDVLEVNQVGAAMDALYERANFERYIKSWMSVNNATKPQQIANYDMTVLSAVNERAKRPTYRAVCEHDGLTWQRSHQEEKRNKTKAELLAEERDYKRRRMSYRGKKLKRTPLQVLHDIIENHMTEITDAGGIGCFSKQPVHIPFVSYTDLESQQQVQGNIPSKPTVQDHSGSVDHLRMTNFETADNVPRLYDGHRETSGAARNEFRPSSQGRYNDERHHNIRR